MRWRRGIVGDGGRRGVKGLFFYMYSLVILWKKLGGTEQEELIK
jgi:hypothetical protein